MRLGAPFAVFFAFGLLLAGSASATTFCAPTFTPACPNNGTNVLKTSLESAMQTDGTDGVPDQIFLAPGANFTNANQFEAQGTDPLAIHGAGIDSNTLTTSSATSVPIVNFGSRPGATISDLTIVIPDFTSSGGSGVLADSSTLNGVAINTHQGDAQAVSAEPTGSTTIANSHFFGSAGGDFIAGINVGSGAAVFSVDHTTVEEAVNPINTLKAGTSISVNHSVLKGNGGGQIVAAEGGTVNISNSVLTTPGSFGLFAAPLYGETTINADHDTIVGSGTATIALDSTVPAATPGSATINITSSIVRGFATSYSRKAAVSPVDGQASISVRYSDLPAAASTPGTEVDTGDGTLDIAQGDIDADPLFASATDFSLLPGSPAIDAADPASTDPDDFAGTTRPKDGNADGKAISDMGAFEAPAVADTTAPQTKKGKGTHGTTRSTTATFRFSSEPGARFQCKLDKKAFAGCKSPRRYKHVKAGKHTFLVRAIDKAGNVDKTPAKSTFRVVRRKHRHTHGH